MTPTTYPITTLRDIFNLPTLEQAKTCLDELGYALLQAKAADVQAIAALKDLDPNLNLEHVFEWPEVCDWVDDGLGEVGLTFQVPDLGEEVPS